MKYPYTFLSFQFRCDLEKYMKSSSCRKLSDDIRGMMSPSTISRILTGKKKDITAVELCSLCHIIGTSPSDYFERVLF